MHGLPDNNYPAFDAAAKRWRDLGHEVINPTEAFNDERDLPTETYLTQGIESVLACDAVLLLPGWEKSTGALTEALVAVATGKDLMSEEYAGIPGPSGRFKNAYKAGMLAYGMRPLTDYHDDIAQEAGHIVATTRQGDYSHPAIDFTRIANLWRSYLGFDGISPTDVAMMMVLLKTARMRNRYGRDTVVDIAGYAKTASLIEEERKRRETT